MALAGVVQHLDYQGHETLVHLDTGSTPALVADLESPRPRQPGRTRGNTGPGMLTRIKDRALAHITAPVVEPDPPQELPRRRAISTGDLIVRMGTDRRLRTGAQVPLLVDVTHLYVFDQLGRRIFPAPARVPGLDI